MRRTISGWRALRHTLAAATLATALGGLAAAWAGGAVAAPAAAPAAPAPVQPFQVARMDGAQACVALTFDDGPDAALTPKLLSVLEAKNAVATFFVVGYRVQSWPDPVARASADGDEIGNHSWDHPALPSLGNAMALGELTRTDDVIRKVTGRDPDVTRAPYGSMSPRIAALSPRTYVAWSIDTLDWKYPDVNYITNAALKAVNGSIILMHDIHPKTIDAVPGIIDGLRARGFQLVTVDQLLGGMCGGAAGGYGTAVPGEVASDPFGVDTFQGQLASAPPVKAPVAQPSAAAAKPAGKTPAAAVIAPKIQPANRAPYALFNNTD